MIVLASASAVRAKMLRDSGVSFELVSSGVDEAAPKARLLKAGASPREIAQHLAEAKGLAVSSRGVGLVIGADQTLDLDGELIDKAEDLSEARERLQRLRGRSHTLHTAVALARSGEVIWRLTASPRLLMRDFTDTYLDAYLAASGEAVLSSVGCYHLEGSGAQLFERIEGDYFSVLGLPLIELLGALRSEGALQR